MAYASSLVQRAAISIALAHNQCFNGIKEYRTGQLSPALFIDQNPSIKALVAAELAAKGVFVVQFTEEWMPANLFQYHDVPGQEPPWLFGGYTRLEATTLRQAELEFEDMCREYFVGG